MMVNKAHACFDAPKSVPQAKIYLRHAFDTGFRRRWLTLMVMTLLMTLWTSTPIWNPVWSVDQTDDKEKVIMALGDSLTAGYGLPTGDGFVPQLQAWLNTQSDTPIRVVNAGVSGDTSSGGRSRLAWSMAGAGATPDLVILELGANDGLRGIDPKRTRENLDAIVADLTAKNITVLIAGMMAPPNLGPDYAADFNPIYPDLAEKYGLPLYPFFLDGVAADPSLNQDDGIHPTKEGVAIIIKKIGPKVISALNDSGR